MIPIKIVAFHMRWKAAKTKTWNRFSLNVRSKHPCKLVCIFCCSVNFYVFNNLYMFYQDTCTIFYYRWHCHHKSLTCNLVFIINFELLVIKSYLFQHSRYIRLQFFYSRVYSYWFCKIGTPYIYLRKNRYATIKIPSIKVLKIGHPTMARCNCLFLCIW